MNLKDLAKPIDLNDIELRVGSTKDDKGMALAYVTARAVMDRLDEVCGPENWSDSYSPAPNGGVLCTLSIKIGDEWVSKADAADNTDFEPVKGGMSSAFKRAGVKWGIGRYLYGLKAPWVPIVSYGKTKKIEDVDRAMRLIFDATSSGATKQTAAPTPAGKTDGQPEPHWSTVPRNKQKVIDTLASYGVTLEDFFKANEVSGWETMPRCERTAREAIISAKEFCGIA